MSNAQKAISGGKWITVSTAVSTIFQFVQVTILARILDPAAFGLVSVSTLIINFFYIFSNLGFSNSIIYKQEDDKKVLSSLYILSLMMGVFIFALVYLSAPLIIAYYKEPRLDPVVKLASLYFLIIYFGQLYLFLMQKELQFRQIAIMEISGAVVGTAVAITLAYNGHGEFSLIYGQLAMHTVRTALQILFGRKLFTPQFYFNFGLIKEHIRFGVYNVGDGLLGFIQGNSDNIIIGGLLGVKPLGYYTVAYQLAVFPITKLNPIILQVAYPILAKMKEDASELKRSYIKILDLISYLNLPLLAGLFITADGLVPLVYGPGWEPTLPLIKIFVFQSFFSCLAHPLFTLAFTKGKPNLLFYLNLITLAVKIPLLFVFGKYWGVIGIALAFLTATIINLVINFFMAHSLIGSFFRDFVANILKPLTFCLLMVGLIALYKLAFGHEGPIHLFVQIALGGLVFVGLTLRYKLSLAEIKAFRR
ncbi:colanic acid undecaprenyl disphosphate flippase WzxC [Nibrella viscosa]|uniref:Colanic acid undecaprenyl disphosphate flippase WzxC n=1 Tax=Nibrella viscosa TaxID=1084524 RepID=A0ABP8KM06_9BACT